MQDIDNVQEGDDPVNTEIFIPASSDGTLVHEFAAANRQRCEEKIRDSIPVEFLNFNNIHIKHFLLVEIVPEVPDPEAT